ncbi:hypothetical protein FHG87_010849 [Trinorchestia longiramus]|nr:hypothetical protein FHG87_010849 [Trinorchestia longiramus]
MADVKNIITGVRLQIPRNGSCSPALRIEASHDSWKLPPRVRHELSCLSSKSLVMWATRVASFCSGGVGYAGCLFLLWWCGLRGLPLSALVVWATRVALSALVVWATRVASSCSSGVGYAGCLLLLCY